MVESSLFPEEHPAPGPDPAAEAVEIWLRTQPEWERRFGEVLRQAIDEVLDGQRTGRYDIGQLAKTEKTYLGTKVEIVFQAEFDLGRGKTLDYLIANHEVDCKFSLTLTGWTIPREAVGELCLLFHADDRLSQFSVGLVRAEPGSLSRGENQDGKKRLSKKGRAGIRWLVRKGPLPENLLLGLDPRDRATILGLDERNVSGQERVNRLLRLVQGKLVRREVVLAVGKQADAPKRVRDARNHLRPEGVLVLGHQGTHPQLATRLGLPVPPKGSWISIRVIRIKPETPNRRQVPIGDETYALAEPNDPTTPAPESY